MKVSKGKIQGKTEPKSEPALFSLCCFWCEETRAEVASTVH